MFSNDNPDIALDKGYTTHEDYTLEMQADENKKLKAQLRRNKRLRALARDLENKNNEIDDSTNI